MSYSAEVEIFQMIDDKLGLRLRKKIQIALNMEGRNPVTVNTKQIYTMFHISAGKKTYNRRQQRVWQ